MLKTGICDWFGYRTDNEERFRLIRKAGFDSVLLWWGDEYADYVGDKNFYRRWRGMQDLKLKIYMLHLIKLILYGQRV